MSRLSTSVQSPALRATRPLLRWAEKLTTPFLPDDYLEQLNPLWSNRAIHAKVLAIRPQTADAATLVLQAGRGWTGHVAGQYLRVAVPVNGVRHWRCYSITSLPQADDGTLHITVKAVESGRVSTELVRNITVGSHLEIAAAAGDFTWAAQGATPPEKVLMIAAGSGITPVMALLQDAAARKAMPDTVLLHYARTAADVIFGDALQALAAAHPALKIVTIHTRGDGTLKGHFGAEHLRAACPDWAHRATWACGPAALLDTVEAQWAACGLSSQLTLERFQPKVTACNAGARGGQIAFTASGCAASSAGDAPILITAEAAGLAPANGCRMGICHGCTATLQSGQVRDLRDGRVFGEEGDLIQICVCAPAGDVQIAL
jgi:stearoyl-CoA 9-desaturase NADPH oxidoreductase